MGRRWGLGDRLLLRAAPRAAWILLRLLRATLRLEYRHREVADGLTREGKRFIIAFWHGRLALMPYSYFGPRISILISRHQDGELIARTMACFGFQAVRGSASRGGGAALREVVRRARAGQDIAFTPDGPRGPRQVAQPGVVAAARLTGLPILPVSFGAGKKKPSAAGTASSFPCLSAVESSATAS